MLYLNTDIFSSPFFIIIVKNMSGSWILSYIRSAAPSSETSYLLIRSFCWKPSEGKRIKAEASKQQGNFSGDCIEKWAGVLVMGLLPFHWRMLRKRACNSFHHSFPCSNSPFCNSVLTWFFPLSFFKSKTFCNLLQKGAIKMTFGRWWIN